MGRKIIIKPNTDITIENIIESNQFSSNMFGKIQAIRQEFINKLKKPNKVKRKIRLKVNFK
jgi:inorganic pyrophosphatase